MGKSSTSEKREVFDRLKEAKVGDYVLFGKYPQDKMGKKKEDIEWLVLDKDEDKNKILVISKYALDCQPYNIESKDITWETCSLRKWLNGTFLEKAFDSDEQKLILSSTVKAEKNPGCDTPPGNDTTDKVFLLSIPETERYFDSDKARKCKITEYSHAMGARILYTKDCWWWLRSYNNSIISAAVTDTGDVLEPFAYDETIAVRPALWIDTEDWNKKYSAEYENAISLLNHSNIIGAYETLISLNGYKDSMEKANEIYEKYIDARYGDDYDKALSLLNDGNITEAYETLISLNGYKDSAEKANMIVEKYSDAKKDDVYNKALSLLNNGNITEAYETLVGLDGYKDSKEKADEIYNKYKKAKLIKANIGDPIFFGRYPQDKTGKKKEDIEWLVLAKEDNKVLIISKYALDCRKYNTSCADITWETCSLRKWLNETFLKEAFNSDEQTMVLSSAVTADKNPKFDTPPGNDTTDKVFLLSIPEVKKYFYSVEERLCFPTNYAIEKGAHVYYQDNTCQWWLRSPGIDSDCAASVNGSNIDDYDVVTIRKNAVRPALWINIKGLDKIYDKAISFLNGGKIIKAYETLIGLDGYKDSMEKANEIYEKYIDAKYGDDYDKALSLLNEGNVIDAYETLISLDGYKDSKEKTNQIYSEFQKAKLKKADIGDYIYFGRYPQDEEEKKEDIEWLVLAKEDNKVLVISKYAIDCRVYGGIFKNVTWETSLLRKWLNETFLRKAFNTKEQKFILNSTVRANRNPDFKTRCGNNTKDKVFLLSIQEAKKYFSSDKGRQCRGTAYCYAHGAHRFRNKNCSWWLRSPGYSSEYAAIVNSFGSFNDDYTISAFGELAHKGDIAVRPAMWISLDN